MKPHQHIAPQWFTIEGACKYSGLSDGTICNYIREGYTISANVILPGNSRGRRIINRPSLDAFIERYVAGTKRETNKQQQSLLMLLKNAADAIAEARRIASGNPPELEP
jgi:hypothetical protein